MQSPHCNLVRPVVGLLLLWLTALPANAATITAASVSYADVSAAVVAAVNGDTVRIPAGTATWTSTLNVGAKAIVIMGAGSAETIIGNQAGMLVKWSGTGANPLRLSGIRFDNSDNQAPIVGIAGPATKFRVDHCLFNKGDCAIGANFWPGASGSGPTYGVIDHCEFINMKRAHFSMDSRNNDGGEAAWSENIMEPGTEKMVYLEDNKFIWNANLTDVNAQGALYGQYGGKTCFRYNTCSGFMTYIDAHGDGPDQSTMYYEIYNNTFIEDNSHGIQGNICWQRGGQWIVHDNTFTGASLPLRMSVYWPTDALAHRVKNTYIWGNSKNGNPNQAALVGVNDSGQTSAGYSAANIRIGQEYFLNAPQSGQTYYPYTPLVHPHPLVTAQDGGATHPATVTAASVSYADVAAAVAQAQGGDTVIIPSGTATWGSTLAVTKSISIIGGGVANTRLINSQVHPYQGGESPLFSIALAHDDPVRISGIYCQDHNVNFDSDGIDIGNFGSVHETKIEIDHCTFEGFAFANKILGAFGVAHDCTYINNKIIGRTAGYYNTASLSGHSPPPFAWNSANYWVWEDIHGIYQNWSLDAYLFDTEFPANYMVRHSIFDVQRSTAVTLDGFDMHGEAGNALRPLGIQIYGNTWNYTGNNTVNPIRLVDIRGGVGSLVYDNTVNGVDIYATLRDDPAQSPLLSDTYLWGNHGRNGGSLGVGTANGVQPGVHFFAFKPSNFAQLAYPHPLRTGATPVNHAPLANGQSVSLAKDTAKTITLSGSDADGDALTYVIAAGPAHGSLSGSGAGRTYTPTTGYTGTDSFTFTVSDGMATSSPASVSITVTAPITTNQVPTVSAVTAAPSPVTATTATLSATASDDGGEAALTYTWSASGPAPVVFSPNGSNAARLSIATFNKAGSYTLTVTAKDAGNLTTTRSATVTVQATPTALSISPTGASVQPGMMVDFNAVATDQFDVALASQPTLIWTASGGGTIDANGLFTAGAGTASPNGGTSATSFVVTGSAGGVSGTALVTVSAASTATTGDGAGKQCGAGSALALIGGLGLMLVARRRR